MKQKIAIFGAGDLGRELYVLIQQINDHSLIWDFVGFFDDDKNKGKLYYNFPIIGNLDDLNNYPDTLNLVIALGDPAIKEKVYKNISNPNIKFPVIKHPSVQIFDYQKIKIGEGTVICAGNILTHNINIGNHVLINLSCSIGHDCIVNDFTSIMPGTNISGRVFISNSVYIGTGTKIINSISIGEGAIIGAGAVVNKNIKKGTTSVGVPAKPIKHSE